MAEPPKVSWTPNDGNTIKVTFAFEWDATDLQKTAGMFGAIGALFRTTLDESEREKLCGELDRVLAELQDQPKAQANEGQEPQ